MSQHGSQLLLILAGRDHQSLAELAKASSLNPTETGIQLHRLIEQGFIVAADDVDGVTVYRLQPKAVPPDALDPHERILVVEDELMLRELMVDILDDDGYAVIAAAVPGDATTILSQVRFDLVITDGFAPRSQVELLDAQAVLQAAGVTPVALFTAHKFELDDTLRAGFQALIAKPFDVETLEQQVRSLLRR